MEIRWNAAAIWADSVGEVTPGRNATRNLRLRVSRISAAVTSQASSHHVPVGVSTPSKPSWSAVLAMDARYSMSASRKWLAVPRPSTGRPMPCGTLWPPPTRPRASPVVGRNQCSLMLMLVLLRSSERKS